MRTYQRKVVAAPGRECSSLGVRRRNQAASARMQRELRPHASNSVANRGKGRNHCNRSTGRSNHLRHCTASAAQGNRLAEATSSQPASTNGARQLSLAMGACRAATQHGSSQGAARAHSSVSSTNVGEQQNAHLEQAELLVDVGKPCGNFAAKGTARAQAASQAGIAGLHAGEMGFAAPSRKQ